VGRGSGGGRFTGGWEDSVCIDFPHFISFVLYLICFDLFSF
jgi:hypothetical protein